MSAKPKHGAIGQVWASRLPRTADRMVVIARRLADASVMVPKTNRKRGTTGEKTRLADDLIKVSDKMDAISVKMEARTNELTMIEARQTAQQERVVLFWSITWPALEARLKRTEDRLDRRER